ncbi:MAG: aminotransferase class I/II-fold pyridoxal phosphate-dependent enzyme [Rhodopirellula sp.]|nr:aminotransferase class I/II-fold pyridoxal phosphate-dependent enzyme [Rhodopirellula sp.]
MPESDSVTSTMPAERIQQAFSPGNLKELTHRLADILGRHMESVQASAGNVLNWYEPPENCRLASEFLDPASPLQNGVEPLVDRFEVLAKEMLARGHNLHDPRYIGHQVPASVPLAGLFDAIGSVTNQVMAVYEMGPWATAVERSLIDRIGQAIGFEKDTFAGLVTHGGTLGNMTGLLTARNVTLGDAWGSGLQGSDKAPVLVAHGDSHYSISRTAGILGIGTRNVVRVKLDQRRRMDPQHLDETLTVLRKTGTPIVAVCACACATPIGAFDPLPEIAEICRRHEVWLHVDAAHGGAACLSKKYRHLIAGLEQADSVVTDAHKMMFVPALCAFVFYRNRDHRFEAFQQDAPYLFDPSSPGLAEYDSGMQTLECTKRAASYGLWGIWSLFGQQLFSDMIDATFDLGRVFYEKLVEAPDFEPLHEPQCNIVAFQYVPDELRDAPHETLNQFLLKLRHRLIRSGEFYIVQTKIDGKQALRVTIINPLTTVDHLDGLLDAIRRTGREVLDSEHE